MIAKVERMSDSPDNRPDLRISDTDRDRAAEVLREAHAQGRITVDELDERLTSVYNAKTFADLVPVTRDLPATPDATASARGRGGGGRRVRRDGRCGPRRRRARCPRGAANPYYRRRGDGRHRGQARPGPAIITGRTAIAGLIVPAVQENG